MEPGVVAGLAAFAVVVGAYGSIIGAGGGFLMIPGLVLLFGLEGAEAVGTGAIALACLLVTGAFSYDRQGLVDRPVAARWIMGAAPVALLAGWLLTNRLESDLLLTIIGVLMVVLALFVALRPIAVVDDSIAAPVMAPRTAALLAGACCVGVLNGGFAVGGGLITVPYLAKVQRLSVHRAAATTSAAGAVASSAATVGHGLAGNIVWTHAPILMAGAIVGSTVGARMAWRLSPRVMTGLLSAGLVIAGAPLIGFAQLR